jgi:hypothetical protein
MLQLPLGAPATARVALAAVERYQIFHLPALFVVCEGQFLGQLQTRLTSADLADAINQALIRTPEDLP